MQVPALLYGEYADVRKKCRRIFARSLSQRQPLLDAFEGEGMIDTADHPGLLVVDGPSSSSNRYVHYQCFVPLRLVFPGMEQSLGPLDPEAEGAIFTALLERPWGMLCMLSSNNMNLMFTREEPESYRRYLLAMLRHWDLLDREGPRYSPGVPLWSVALPVRQALARLGVPQQLLNYVVPLPVGGLPALVAHADPALAGDLLALASAAAARLHREASAAPAATVQVPAVALPEREDVFMSGAMEAAVLADDADTVRHLVASGESASALNSTADDSLLFWAIRRGHADLVPLLLDHGADIEDRWAEGESPLMMAAWQGQRGTVRLLLDRGADPNYVTDKGWDVVQFAKMSGDNQLIALLKEVFQARE